MDDAFIELARRATSGSSRIDPLTAGSPGRRVRSPMSAEARRRELETSPVVRLQLVDDGEWLQWEQVTGLPVDLEGIRSARPVAGGGEVEAMQMEFQRLPPSQITAFLSRRDERLTPHRGLRRLDPADGTLVPAAPPSDGRALIFIHGTFSNGESILSGLLDPQHAEGNRFLHEALRYYEGQVYTFDHPTLAVGPLLNAIDLQRTLSGGSAKVDLVGHSRGGLLARWWCETFDPHAQRCDRAVLIGAPLSGTALAAPPNIRDTISLLTQLSRALKNVSALAALAMPVFSVVEATLRVLTSIASLGARTPAVDAAMALVPGLFAMSRVGNNPELGRLLGSGDVVWQRYSAVLSDFQPSDPMWKFWRAFRPERIAATAADTLFDGANDLVVDTGSMTDLADGVKIDAKRRHEFGVSETVHHLNYFYQPETACFLGDRLLRG